jgi:hypothetical protein
VPVLNETRCGRHTTQHSAVEANPLHGFVLSTCGVVCTDTSSRCSTRCTRRTSCERLASTGSTSLAACSLPTALVQLTTYARARTTAHHIHARAHASTPVALGPCNAFMCVCVCTQASTRRSSSTART